MRKIFYFLLLFLSSCIWNNDHISSSPEYRRLFDKTPCQQIAKAILRDDSTKIERLIKKNVNLVNYRDSVWGQTLLMYSVYFNKKNAVEILLKYGADPNVYEDSITHQGSNSILIACNYDHVSSEILSILLDNGGDPESHYCGVLQDNLGHYYKVGSYAVQVASGRNLKKLKMLLKYGANLGRWSGEHSSCPTMIAAEFEKMEILLYLLEHDADYDCVSKSYNESDTTEIGLCGMLRRCVFPLGSKEHFYKMKVVDYLQEKGIKYQDEPIPEYVINDVQRCYPNSWQEYLRKY